MGSQVFVDLKECVDIQKGVREGVGVTFEWDPEKEAENVRKHGVDFSTVPMVFSDPRRLIFPNVKHSGTEPRFYAVGDDGHGVLTVRFTMRGETIRVIGAGYWRKQRKQYEKEIH